MGEQAQRARGSTNGNACHGTILVVDDDVDIRDTLRDALETGGYSTVTAENGRDALDKLATMKRPCLILLDLMMPVMDGLEFLTVGLTTQAIVGVPVVVITAYDHLAARATESTAILKKPIDLDVLMTWVERFCG